MGEFVIVAYRPKPGFEAELHELVRGHVPFLRELGLATRRSAVAMRNADGDVIEIFEWESGAVDKAHGHPGVQALWSKFAAVCDYLPLRELPEAQAPFAHFEPLFEADPGASGPARPD